MTPEEEACRRFAAWDAGDKHESIKYDPTGDAFYLARLYARSALKKHARRTPEPTAPADEAVPTCYLGKPMALVVTLTEDPLRKIDPQKASEAVARLIHATNSLSKAMGGPELAAETESRPGEIEVAFTPKGT